MININYIFKLLLLFTSLTSLSYSYNLKCSYSSNNQNSKVNMQNVEITQNNQNIKNDRKSRNKDIFNQRIELKDLTLKHFYVYIIN